MQVPSALYNGHKIVKTNHAPAIMHDSEDTLEIADITRKKMLEKMKIPTVIKCKNADCNDPPDKLEKEMGIETNNRHVYLTEGNSILQNALQKILEGIEMLFVQEAYSEMKKFLEQMELES
ncbi:hypothetical protein Tco_0052739 [Tanacetum coccineum]